MVTPFGASGRDGGSRDIVVPLQTAILSANAIQGDLFDLTRGAHPGRTNAEHITLFESVGVVIEDRAAASQVYEKPTQSAYESTNTVVIGGGVVGLACARIATLHDAGWTREQIRAITGRTIVSIMKCSIGTRSSQPSRPARPWFRGRWEIRLGGSQQSQPLSGRDRKLKSRAH